MSVTVVTDAPWHNVSCDTPVHTRRVNRSGCECTVMTDAALQNLSCDTPVHYRESKQKWLWVYCDDWCSITEPELWHTSTLQGEWTEVAVSVLWWLMQHYRTWAVTHQYITGRVNRSGVSVLWWLMQHYRTWAVTHQYTTEESTEVTVTVWVYCVLWWLMLQVELWHTNTLRECQQKWVYLWWLIYDATWVVKHQYTQSQHKWLWVHCDD